MQMPGYGKSRRDQAHGMPSLGACQESPRASGGTSPISRLRGQVRLGEPIGCNSGYTETMKTASLATRRAFSSGGSCCRRLRVSSSRLYVTAMSEFLNRQQGNAVNQRLNKVYSRRPATVDRALHRAQLRSLEKDSC